MSAADIARDLMANGLEGVIEGALKSAAEQGEGFARGTADELVERHDNAYAEWRIAAEGYGEVSTEANVAHRVYLILCQELAPKLIELVREEGT